MNVLRYFSRRTVADFNTCQTVEMTGDRLRIYPYQGLAIVAYVRPADQYQLQSAILRLRRIGRSFRNFGEPLYLPFLDILAREQPTDLTVGQREQIEATMIEVMLKELASIPQFSVRLQGIELDGARNCASLSLAAAATPDSSEVVKTLVLRLCEGLKPLLKTIHPGLQLEPPQDVKVPLGFLGEAEEIGFNRELAFALDELCHVETELWIERISLVRFRQMSLGDAETIHEIQLPPPTDHPIKQAIAKSKVCVIPRWARWCGFSYLWDNPGSSLSRRDKTGPWQIACAPWQERELELYRALGESLIETGLDSTTNLYSFCPLPSSSYHVTAWDGINEGNLSLIAPPHRERFAEFMLGLPKSATQPPPELIDLKVFDGSLDAGPIQFKFDGLRLWGDAVLMAQLSPANEASARILERVREWRHQLDERFASMGRVKSLDYSPHVSLGYFNHPTAARMAADYVPAWESVFRRLAHGSQLAFQTISAYAFDSMDSFYKLGFSELDPESS